MKCFALLALIVSPAAAVVNLRKVDACEAEDLKRRSWLQNKLAGDCETMCKEVGAYPKGCTCADFTYDKTPGVMTWPELLAHMDNLVEWGGPRGLLKAWQSQASSVLQKTGLDAKACAALDLQHRAQVQNKLATACEDMCKEIGAYPKCECPGFAPPDSTPGVMTWEELNEHMDNLVAWGLDMIKKAKARAGALLQNQTKAVVASNSTHKKICTMATISHNTPPGSAYTEVNPSADACQRFEGVQNWKLCGGGATLYACTGSNCDSCTKIEHGTSKTMADCTTESAEYFNSYKYSCAY